MFLNSVACTGVLGRNESIGANSSLLLHLDNIMINCFHMAKVKDMRSLKDVLFDKILNYEIKIDNYVHRVADLSEGGTTLRLKMQFADIFEPYIFNKYQRLAGELYEGAKLLASRNKQVDVYLGNGELYHNQSIIYRVMEKLFADEIPKYCMLCLRLDSFTSDFTIILKHTLKLLHIYLLYALREIEMSFFSEHRPLFDNLIKV